MNEDGIMVGLLTACTLLLVFSFVACTQGIIADNKVRKQLELDNCSLISKKKQVKGFTVEKLVQDQNMLMNIFVNLKGWL